MLSTIGKQINYKLNMNNISTYLFIDLETTGLPSEEINKTKITEICLVAVKRNHLLDTNIGEVPRVCNKLSLCLNPRRFIHPQSTWSTKLCNDLLEHETPFNSNVSDTLNNFIRLLSEPICMIAYNGNRFDFPILKRQLEDLGVQLHCELLCADSFICFHHLVEERLKRNSTPPQNDSEFESADEDELIRLLDEASHEYLSQKMLNKSQSNIEHKKSIDFVDKSLSIEKSQDIHNFDSYVTKKIDETHEAIENNVHLNNELNISTNMIAIDDIKFIKEPKILNGTKRLKEPVEDSDHELSLSTSIELLPNSIADYTEILKQNNSQELQEINEHTPKKLRVKQTKPTFKRKLFQQKVKLSYKLSDLYERLLNKPAVNAHRAEIDCYLMLECAVVLKKDFVEWCDQNSVFFKNIKPMTVGVPLGPMLIVAVLWGATNPFIKRGTKGLRSVTSNSKLGQICEEVKYLLFNWQYVCPWLINQLGSLVYLVTLQNNPLSLVVIVANSMTLVVTAITSRLLGEEPLSYKSILGVCLILFGTILCCMDKR